MKVPARLWLLWARGTLLFTKPKYGILSLNFITKTVFTLERAIFLYFILLHITVKFLSLNLLNNFYVITMKPCCEWTGMAILAVKMRGMGTKSAGTSEWLTWTIHATAECTQRAPAPT